MQIFKFHFNSFLSITQSLLQIPCGFVFNIFALYFPYSSEKIANIKNKTSFKHSKFTVHKCIEGPQVFKRKRLINVLKPVRNFGIGMMKLWTIYCTTENNRLKIKLITNTL